MRFTIIILLQKKCRSIELLFIRCSMVNVLILQMITIHDEAAASNSKQMWCDRIKNGMKTFFPIELTVHIKGLDEEKKNAEEENCATALCCFV